MKKEFEVKSEEKSKEIKEITANSEVAKCIKAIGQDLINRADDISNDIKDVSSITIYSKIVGGDIINYDVTKNYCTKEFINYNEIYKERRKELGKEDNQ